MTSSGPSARATLLWWNWPSTASPKQRWAQSRVCICVCVCVRVLVCSTNTARQIGLRSFELGSSEKLCGGLDRICALVFPEYRTVHASVMYGGQGSLCLVSQTAAPASDSVRVCMCVCDLMFTFRKGRDWCDAIYDAQSHSYCDNKTKKKKF